MGCTIQVMHHVKYILTYQVHQLVDALRLFVRPWLDTVSLRACAGGWHRTLGKEEPL